MCAAPRWAVRIWLSADVCGAPAAARSSVNRRYLSGEAPRPFVVNLVANFVGFRALSTKLSTKLAIKFFTGTDSR
jgi:hypothetical protein